MRTHRLYIGSQRIYKQQCAYSKYKQEAWREVELSGHALPFINLVLLSTEAPYVV